MEKQEKSVSLNVGKNALTGGSVLAMIISYDVNHSVLYAILHGFCSWGYVIYHLIAH